jgi:uncharacterized protein YuzE
VQISYDPEVDAMSITFRETMVTSQLVAEDVALDFDAEGRLALKYWMQYGALATKTSCAM